MLTPSELHTLTTARWHGPKLWEPNAPHTLIAIARGARFRGTHPQCASDYSVCGGVIADCLEATNASDLPTFLASIQARPSNSTAHEDLDTVSNT